MEGHEVLALPADRLKQSTIARFVPAAAVCMVWLYLVTYSHGPLDAHVYAAAHNRSFAAAPLGTVWDELFSEYYPMTLAMVAGSLIAGSTPLGGGVVAFPVAVLVIGFQPDQGRDFTVLIQSVGMNAAAYLILMYKAHLADFSLIVCFVIAGIPGILVGLSLKLAPFYVVLTFQILVLEFAVTFFYLNILAPRHSSSAAPSEMQITVRDEAREKPLNMLLAYGSMCAAAFVGGFLTANVGSGSDIMLYAYGLLGWNLLVPESARFSDASLTASSVVVMGAHSLVTSACRVLTRDISVEVIYCWGATAWLVCFGAPLGSLLITPGLRAQLRIVFYLLAGAQFVGFAVLKIKGRTDAWAAFAATTCALLLVLGAHFHHARSKIERKGFRAQRLSLSTIRYRLIDVCA